MAGKDTVRDYVTLIRGITYKGNLVGKPGPALLGLGAIHPGGGFREGDYKTYGGDCPSKLMLAPGDLFVSLKGATKDGKMIGSVARVPASVPSGRLTQDTVKLEFRSDERAQVCSYLYWVLRTPQYRDYCEGRAMGSAVVALSRDDFLDFPVPPFSGIRPGIVELLERIEEKIELNRRMNATLEAMARALFQSWFVDFDPVRAKLDGRVPVGLDPDTAALFPEHFEESALGPIPQGWEVGSLEDVLTLQRGFDLPTPDRTHGKYPVMAASGPNGCHDKFMVRGPGVTTGRSGVLGRVFFIHGDFWPLNTSLWVKEFKRVSTAYAFHLMRGLGFEMFNAGSAVPTLNRNHVHRLPVVIPPKPIIKAFDSQVMPLMKRQKANEDQSRTLATLRDTLLPKLLSGELSGHCATN
jgi:restriction endonuclease S subunit